MGKITARQFDTLLTEAISLYSFWNGQEYKLQSEKDRIKRIAEEIKKDEGVKFLE